MRIDSIRQHLAPYSIRVKRETTINHAFASALAPNDTYDVERISQALSILGQSPDQDLSCIYCGNPAETWDHLVGLVKDKNLRGYGHQIGNLVPCCKDCNSKKGQKDWRKFLSMRVPDVAQRREIEDRIAAYVGACAVEIELQGLSRRCPEEWAEYNRLKQEIVALMDQADRVAERLRPHVIHPRA